MSDEERALIKALIELMTPTQRAVATGMGVSVEGLRSWSKGRRVPKAGARVKLIAAARAQGHALLGVANALEQGPEVEA